MNDHEKRIRDIEINVAKMTTNLTHIKGQIDNHISTTITQIFGKINEICPLVKENTYWVGKWKQAIFWIAVIGIGGGLVATAFYLLRNLK
ncbi:hypothetical protein ES703_47150 [subsurface metagenome]